ncbi:MAG TPA: N-acetylmuramoyl-L-alanine amidase, partial [Myxococcota bacterium]
WVDDHDAADGCCGGSLVKLSSTTIVCAALLALTLARTAHSDDDPSIAAFGAIKKEVEALRQDKDKKQFRHNYEKLIVRLQAVANTYPEGSKADDAAYVAAQLLEELYSVSRVDADKVAAMDAFVSTADRFPKSNLADDSLLAAARLCDNMPKKRVLLERVVAMGNAADVLADAKRELAALLPVAGLSTDDAAHTSESTAVVAATAHAKLTNVEVLPEAPPPGTPARKIIVIKNDKSATESLVMVRVSGEVGMIRGDVPVAEGGPRRIFYDLAPAKLGQRNIQPIEIHDGVIARVRAGQYDTDVVRLVVELEGDAEPVLSIVKRPTFEVHLSVALAPKPVVASASVTSPPAKVAAASSTSAPNTPPKIGAEAADVRKRFENGTPGGVSISQQMGLAVHRVVIDPGHGGNDTGAIGPDGVKEKDITLQISKRVRDKLLSEMPDLEVVMTRDDDRTLALQDRTNTANSAAADLFISIHCNASPLRRVRGVETYTLNITNDQWAMKLAARENAEMGEGSISDLEFILADLAMKSNVDDSLRLGRAVQKDVMRNLHTRWNDVPDLGLKHALFYVLVGNKMPSILVETSFVSNKVEEQRLASAAYQDSVADGVVEGVREFVQERQAFFQDTQHP